MSICKMRKTIMENEKNKKKQNLVVSGMAKHHGFLFLMHAILSKFIFPICSIKQ